MAYFPLMHFAFDLFLFFTVKSQSTLRNIAVVLMLFLNVAYLIIVQ